MPSVKMGLTPSELDLLASPGDLLAHAEAQNANQQKNVTDAIFDHLLEQAAQPKAVSGKACVKLCGFVEQAAKSSQENVRVWAFSQDVVLRLYHFFTEWNESDHHRSMKLVLDLITHLTGRNPDKEESKETNKIISDDLTAIISGRSVKPVIKSALKALEHLLGKKVLGLAEIGQSYAVLRSEESEDALQLWRSVFFDLFHWMKMHFVCPVASKVISCIFRLLRQREDNNGFTLQMWHQWLLTALRKEPTLLGGIKNYVLLPFFKDEGAEAIQFLKLMDDNSSLADIDLGPPALLHLAALETAKRAGLVEEPDSSSSDQSPESGTSITLDHQILTRVLAHPSQEVRIFACSLLITSPSTTKIYSTTAFSLLRDYLPGCFADSDPKFRVEFSGKASQLYQRVRGAICVLKRSIPRARAKARKDGSVEQNQYLTSQAISYRTNLLTLPESQLVLCLDEHRKFLRWYIGFIRLEMAPTASYQRHAASLRALLYILKAEADSSKQWTTDEDQTLLYDLFGGKWMRTLHDLLLDPFDDIQDHATAALRRIYSDKRYRRFSQSKSMADHDSMQQDVDQLTRKSETLAQRTGRADYSSGASRACQLLYNLAATDLERLELLNKIVNRLDQKMLMAEKDLGQAVIEAPLHGDFASLCLTWEDVAKTRFSIETFADMGRIQESLVKLSERAWAAVQYILCDDSPEGHLPQDMEDVEGLDTKDILSFSFRAIHESSNLMRVLVATLKNRPRQDMTSLSPELFKRIGNLTFTQLSTLRHRGAFTTVSSTFAICCQESKHLEKVDGEATSLQDWYKGTMDAIYSQESLTRRSAGIPCLMTGLLSANAPELPLDQILRNLIDIASKPAQQGEKDATQLPQVHAFNTLREIFRGSLLTSLGANAENYIPDCLELAASGLRSEVWAIRNCGLLFLRSLIDNLFGSQESKAMIEAGWDGKANRIRYHRYPNLPQVLLNLLSEGRGSLDAAETGTVESVFPALDMIRRAGPPDHLRFELQLHISKYLASSVWHMREMAARTLCSCLLNDQWIIAVQDLWKYVLQGSTGRRSNHAQGVLMTAKFVFERLAAVAPERVKADLDMLIKTIHSWNVPETFVHSPEVLAAYLELVNYIRRFQVLGGLRLSVFGISNCSRAETALLKIQRAINTVILATEDTSPRKRLAQLFSNHNHDTSTDGLIAALATMRELWHTDAVRPTVLSDICGLYVAMYATEAIDVRIAVMENLADGLRSLLLLDETDDVPTDLLKNLWYTIGMGPMNPSLGDAVIEASGGIMAWLCRYNTLSSKGLRGWGCMIQDAGREDKPFDTRLAAAEALNTFFATAPNPFTTNAHLPALIALYDVLNDDSEDVRNMGSDAAKSILHRAAAPLYAAKSLLEWVTLHFCKTEEFQNIAVERLANATTSGDPWTPAGQQLAMALQVDDSLFVIEEQNLFIDEVRETDRWLVALLALRKLDLDCESGSGSEDAFTKFESWVVEGLSAIQTLIQSRPDGPLGWASDQHVFAICSRVLTSAWHIQRMETGGEKLTQAWANFRTVVATYGEKHQISPLLLEVMAKPTEGHHIGS